VPRLGAEPVCGSAPAALIPAAAGNIGGSVECSRLPPLLLDTAESRRSIVVGVGYSTAGAAMLLARKRCSVIVRALWSDALDQTQCELWVLGSSRPHVPP
jgi:hypothetical protein